jgi:hypothetical protein
MISFTLAMAFAVRVMGAVFGFASGVVVMVAINVSLRTSAERL